MRTRIVLVCLVMLTISARTSALSKGDKEKDDFNFDGKEDYRIFAMSNGRSQIWEYHLSNSDGESREAIILDLPNPLFSGEEKKVYTYLSGGHSGLIFVSDIYSWKNNRLHLEATITQKFDETSKQYVLVKLENLGERMLIQEVNVVDYQRAKKNAELAAKYELHRQ